MADSHNIDRRGFVKIVVTFLGTVMGAVVGLPAIGYLISPALKAHKAETWIPVGPLESYPIGNPTMYNFTRTTVNGWEKTVNSYGVHILRVDENQVKALSNLCTHLSCRVSWKEEGQDYVCPCHDGHFGADGKVVSGPPPEPLHEYETKLEDGTLFIHYVEG